MAETSAVPTPLVRNMLLSAVPMAGACPNHFHTIADAESDMVTAASVNFDAARGTPT